MKIQHYIRHSQDNSDYFHTYILIEGDTRLDDDNDRCRWEEHAKDPKIDVDSHLGWWES